MIILNMKFITRYKKKKKGLTFISANFVMRGGKKKEQVAK